MSTPSTGTSSINDDEEPYIELGCFLVFERSRRILKAGQPVLVGSRAFELLLTLLEVPGAVVSKRQLLERVWPGQDIDEGSLRVHISALRKAFDDHSKRYIINVSGRGYSINTALVRETGFSLPLSHGLLSDVRKIAGLHGVSVSELLISIVSDRVAEIKRNIGARSFEQ